MSAEPTPASSDLYNQLHRYHSDKTNSIEIRVVKNDHTFQVKAVEKVSDWTIKRWIQQWWRGETYETKAFTAQVLAAMNLPSIQAERKAKMESINKRVQAIAINCFKIQSEPIIKVKKESDRKAIKLEAMAILDEVSSQYIKDHGDLEAKNIQKSKVNEILENSQGLKKELQEDITKIPRDPKIRFQQIGKDWMREWFPQVLDKSGSEIEEINPRQKIGKPRSLSGIRNILTYFAHFIGEKDLFKSSKQEYPVDKAKSEADTIAEVTHFFEKINPEETKLIKLLRLLTQLPSLEGTKFTDLLRFGKLEWQFSPGDPEKREVVAELLPEGKIRLVNLLPQRVQNLTTGESYSFNCKMTILLDKEMDVKPEDVSIVVSDLLFEKMNSNEEKALIKTTLQPFMETMEDALKESREIVAELPRRGLESPHPVTIDDITQDWDRGFFPRVVQIAGKKKTEICPLPTLDKPLKKDKPLKNIKALKGFADFVGEEFSDTSLKAFLAKQKMKKHPRLIKLLRTLTQSLGTPLSAIEKQLTEEIGYARQDMKNRDFNLQIIDKKKMRITLSMPMRGYIGNPKDMGELDKTKFYRFTAKVVVECGPDMQISPQNVSVSTSDPKFIGLTEEQTKQITAVLHPLIKKRQIKKLPPLIIT